MIRETLALINNRIARQITSVAVQTNGIAIPYYDQQEGTTTLKLEDGSRLTLDNRYLWQSAHLTKGARPVGKQTWGSFTDEMYEPAYTLIAVCKSPNGLNIAMRALDGVAHVVNDGYNDKTLEVLGRYWYVKTGPDKNYDPDLYAFAIDYHLTGVDDLDFAPVPAFGDVSQLPVEVPQPIQGPPGPPGPEGQRGPATGTGYVHVQSVASANWFVNHNLGYFPGGILIYDSAGDQWAPAQVDHVDSTSLWLRFNTSVFSGKAFLS